MTKTALLSIVLLSLLTAACSSKTAALANKNLMSRPLLHSSSSQSTPGRQPDNR